MISASYSASDHSLATQPAPYFAPPVPAGGYIWWYIDALSDDGRHGLTIIAFIGSVFSPYYAYARRRTPGKAPALDYCAVNVALYGACKRWAMTERDRRAVRQSPAQLTIGPSSLSWDGNALTLQLDEVTVPLPSRIRGRVRLYPEALPGRVFTLNSAGNHRWQPIAPGARVEVELQQPALSWSGAAYCDSNAGDEPLEQGFTHWNWSRAGLDGDTVILYDAYRRDRDRLALALRIKRTGSIEEFEAPPVTALPRTAIWKIARATQAEEGHARISRTLEDTPFYARSLISAKLLGKTVTSVHESLSLERFRAGWVQLLLPFRMPRRVWF
jgi:carotenoid 1,2-hydratase